MEYLIKRHGTTVLTVRPAGAQRREAMGVDVVEMSFNLPVYVELQMGDDVEVYGQTYYLNLQPSVQKVSKRNYAYQVTFEAVWYDLAKVQLQMLNPQNALLEPVFDLTGNADTIVGLVVENALRHSAGWTVGVVDETEYQTFSFNGQNCLQALHELADRFDTEFWIDGKTIHLQKREQDSGLTFEYGKGNGLYSITRKGRENARLITRLYVRGGSTNLPPGYGSGSLLLPGGGTYQEDPGVVGDYGLIEATQVFSDIFPTRTGTVSAVVAGAGNWKYFTDGGLDFDLNEQLAPGLDAKVHFVSGDLAGYTFTIDSYNHTTKQFTINANEEETALEIPSDTLRPKVGDKYRLIDIVMPPGYVEDAEDRLQAASWAYYVANSDTEALWEYTVAVDRLFVKQQAVVPVLGNTATLADTEMGINTELRLLRYSRNLQEANDYPEMIFGSRLSANEIVRQYQQQQKTLVLLESSGLLDVNQMRKSLFLNRLSERDGYLMLGANKAKAGLADYAANAGHALVASEAVNADLWDSKDFADYLNQPVRTTDDVVFKTLRSAGYVSGAMGSGYKINEDGVAEFEGLSVRGALRATEFVAEKIRASNGAIAVTDATEIERVVSVEDLGEGAVKYTLELKSNPFVANDIIRCKMFTNGDGGDGKDYQFVMPDEDSNIIEVVAIDWEGEATPEAGDTLVRLGNVSNANRQGLIYLTNADAGAPYIDVLDGVSSGSFAGKTKVRLGKLNGLSDTDLGAMSGYGLYGQNVYLKGKIHVTGGNAETKDGATGKANAAQSNAQSYADTKALAAQNAAINAAASDATAKANAAQANAEAMVEALQIGGRNLLKDTGWDGKYNLGGWYDSLDIYHDDDMPYVKQGLNEWNLYQFLDFYPGTFTVSGYFKNDMVGFNGQIGFTINSEDIDNRYQTLGDASDEWQYKSITFTIISGTGIGIYFKSFNVNTIRFAQLKVEEGNKATAWTPAPEDVDAAISAAQVAADNAQLAHNTLVSNLKAMAYQDVVSLAKLDSTIVDGGYLKTSLLDANYIKTNIINAAYVNTLELNASVITAGTIAGARLDVDYIKTNIVNASYVNTLELVSRNVKTSPTGKRVEIDGDENNVRLVDAAGDDLVIIDDDVAIEHPEFHGYISGVYIDFDAQYGPGVRVGKSSGLHAMISSLGLSLYDGTTPLMMINSNPDVLTKQVSMLLDADKGIRINNVDYSGGGKKDVRLYLGTISGTKVLCWEEL